MPGLIIGILLGFAIAGFLIWLAVSTLKQQSDYMADRIAQADQLIARARHWREDPPPPPVVKTVEVKPAIRPAIL